MIAMLKKTFRFGAITAGLIGLTTFVAFAALGEGRTKTVVRELHGKVLEKIDENVENPSALRSQLREMEREYPERIAQVRGDLSELEHEIRELERERAISERVVALVDEDLERLKEQLGGGVGQADLASSRSVVEVDGRVMSPERARSRLHRMQEQRVLYGNRAADAEHDLTYLHEQADRLEALLAKLETERADFQSQIQGLSRQIDAIARNDRLIQLLERRNETIEECSRYEAVSLEQITGRLAQIKSRQEAELELLANAERQTDYEDLARVQLAGEELEARRPSRDGLANR